MKTSGPTAIRAACAGAAGVIAVGSALAAGELAAVAVSPDASPYFAVGSAVVDRTPDGVREWAITTFGTNDKAALFIGMGVAIVLLAVGSGLAQWRRPPAGSVVIGGFAVVGAVAALNRPTAVWTYAVPSVIAGIVGIVVLQTLVGMLPVPHADRTRDERDTRPDGDVESDPAPEDHRVVVPRRFVLAAGGVVAAAAVLGGIGRRLLADTSRTLADRAHLVLPRPARPAPPIPPGVDLAADGASSFVTSNADFYRIDTALQVPKLTTGDWSLRIHGMVDEEITVTWDELVAMPMVERLVTLTCVSNEVGGDLIGNARWLGVPMKVLLDRAGVRPGADMLLSTSADGWTCGTPVSTIIDGRDAMLAIGMNGEPLPIEHGYPIRQVIPGLYGYVSATKWVVDWEITRFSESSAYWTSRGWSALGPIKLASRIDRPGNGSSRRAGDVVVAGSAWAQHTGIARVEVRIDEGPWQQAELAVDYSDDTWRQWRYVWPATKGDHTVECRAIDKAGHAQVEDIAAPAPDGATGLDGRSYTIT
ncbi:molybdopterin-dependent oxidoreductase [Gordonia sp. ABSL1-1]|uniref:molybdopterin-dependent oxidoreductase n=1 Tax=Gordonia sp. ABSL1-1 TaxID=3053923 RepID=UPI0025736C5F|nr:molybdopterin-dependent oxidoreductase [Gordonia sp. ABSL1-1]MDL9935211.1 molybdopterin-dependent oxidoreductase [Gordonia sp. ABSL1-1]